MPTPELSVLLVDDSRFFLTIEQQFLRRIPVAILEAANCEQTLALCRAKPPDLIYMAYSLPDRSGAEACRLLKADPDLRAIPVVLICDEHQPQQQEACRQAQCDALLTRPLDRRRFVEIGRSFLTSLGEPRRSCLIPIKVEAAEKSFTAKGLDLSSGGVFIESLQSVIPGEKLLLELQLSRPGEDGPWIACPGRVSWVNSKEQPIKPFHPFGFGVRFTTVPDLHQRLLGLYLRQLDK